MHITHRLRVSIQLGRFVLGEVELFKHSFENRVCLVIIRACNDAVVHVSGYQDLILSVGQST